MTQCTQCKSCQILQNEVGQPELFCYRCGGAVEVVSDELPFDFDLIEDRLKSLPPAVPGTVEVRHSMDDCRQHFIHVSYLYDLKQEELRRKNHL